MLSGMTLPASVTYEALNVSERKKKFSLGACAHLDSFLHFSGFAGTAANGTVS